jgi:hypothetical protein
MNRLNLSLKNLERGGYEVGAGVRVCGYLGIKLGSLTKT